MMPKNNSKIFPQLILSGLLLILPGASTLSALDLVSATKDVAATEAPRTATIQNRFAIQIHQEKHDPVSGYLINADQNYLVIENEIDGTIQIIDRSEIKLMETNMNINLFSVINNSNAESLTDDIELTDGTKFDCLIIDINSETVQYFTGNGLKRHVLPTNSVHQLHFNSGSANLPFPVMTTENLALNSQSSSSSNLILRY